MEYMIDTEKIISEIKTQKAKRVMLQLPDGLKPKAKEIVDAIRKDTSAEVLLWAGSCYGACDLPQGLEKFDIDILFHLGHTEWKY